jgi:membrane metallo-endopeptidase-like protein 1
MTNSMKQTVIKNPTWWKRRSALERGLTVMAVSAVLLCIALAIGIIVVVSNSGSCDVTSTNTAVPADTEMLSSTAEALGGKHMKMPSPTIIEKPEEKNKENVCLTPGCKLAAKKSRIIWIEM